MFRYVFTIALLIFTFTIVSAQSTTDEFPGEHSSSLCGSDQEPVRLRQLVEQQSKKIKLLEEKIQILEFELKKSK